MEESGYTSNAGSHAEFEDPEFDQIPEAFQPSRRSHQPSDDEFRGEAADRAEMSRRMNGRGHEPGGHHRDRGSNRFGRSRRGVGTMAELRVLDPMSLPSHQTDHVYLLPAKAVPLRVRINMPGFPSSFSAFVPTIFTAQDVLQSLAMPRPLLEGPERTLLRISLLSRDGRRTRFVDRTRLREYVSFRPVELHIGMRGGSGLRHS
ncbi:MAG: hypothetical protein M1825_005569 [Sarcosagium campestre]|nr:MAG: hypothetical protein M1825_005569 [Sarcosagium campestre]